MRTVHEPEPARGGAHTGAGADPTPPGKKPIKIKLTNGSSGSRPPLNDPADIGPSHDEDGNPVTPSHPNDNISYTPAHHPITGQPGFMITYPPDINFSAWESAIAADQLMRLLRRQVHWAQQEGQQLKHEIAVLEERRKEEWQLKEILLDGVLEEELSRAEKEGLLARVDANVKEAMEKDVESAKMLSWTRGEPPWRTNQVQRKVLERDEDMPDAVATPLMQTPQRTPSPPPTGHSGGFDGEGDPYDNYLQARMAEYNERERLRSLQNTPQKQRAEAEADAVGALMGMSGSAA